MQNTKLSANQEKQFHLTVAEIYGSKATKLLVTIEVTFSLLNAAEVHVLVGLFIFIYYKNINDLESVRLCLYDRITFMRSASKSQFE